MAQIPLNKIFLGHTPIEQRKYITAVFKHLHKTHTKLFIPAVGQFTLVKCAIEAGYKKENIYTSDISFFSSLLGFLFSGKPISDIHFEFDGEAKEEFKNEYEEITDETERVAFLMWLMKLAQMSKVHYQRLMFEDLMENKKKHIADLMGQIIKLRDYFSGIHYEIKDLREEFIARDANALLVINPPVFKKGYTKMFDFKGFIKYESGVEEFDFKKEYLALYEKSKNLSYPTIWYRFGEVDNFNKNEVIFG
mgnify:FL=1